MAIFDQPKSTKVNAPPVNVGVTPGTDKVATSREATEQLIEDQTAGNREMRYQKLKMQRVQNEITGRDFLQQLENMAGTVRGEEEKAKWNNLLETEKLNVLREDQAREDQKIQIGVKSGNMSPQQAAQAYKALSSQAMAAGDVDSALGYELSSVNMMNALRISRGGGGSSSGGPGGTKTSKGDNAKMQEEILEKLAGAQRDWGDNVDLIRNSLGKKEITEDEATLLYKQAMDGFKAKSYDTVTSDTWKKYMEGSATETQKWKAQAKALELTDFFKVKDVEGYTGYENDMISSMAQTTGMTEDEIRGMMGGSKAPQQLQNFSSADLVGSTAEPEKEYTQGLFENVAALETRQAEEQAKVEAPPVSEGGQEQSSGIMSRIGDFLGGGGQGGFAKKVFGLFGR